MNRLQGIIEQKDNIITALKQQLDDALDKLDLIEGQTGDDVTGPTYSRQGSFSRSGGANTAMQRYNRDSSLGRASSPDTSNL